MSTPLSASAPADFSAQIGAFVSRLTGAESLSCVALYSAGRAAEECVSLGVKQKALAASLPYAISDRAKENRISRMLKAMKEFPNEPATAADKARFVAIWNGNTARSAARAAGAVGEKRGASDPLARLKKALKACDKAGVRRADIRSAVMAVYGKATVDAPETAATLAAAA